MSPPAQCEYFRPAFLGTLQGLPVYDYDRMLAIVQEDCGGDDDDAAEYLQYNVVNSMQQVGFLMRLDPSLP